MEQIFIDGAIGFSYGFMVGLMVMLLARDGIWLEVWGWMILIGTLMGVLIGLLKYIF